jgi:hypothetical protein
LKRLLAVLAVNGDVVLRAVLILRIVLTLRVGLLLALFVISVLVLFVVLHGSHPFLSGFVTDTEVPQ